MDIIFETDRILFCKISEYFLDDYVKMVNDPDIAKYICSHDMHVTNEEEREWIKAKIAEKANIFTMVDKFTKKFIGNIELMNIENNTAEVGICITKDMQDKHYGTEAMSAMIDYGYRILGLTSIWLNVYDFNKRAIKCYQNVGFEIDGQGKSENEFHMTHRR